MRIDIMTLFPETVGDMMNESILGRAQERGYIRIDAHQIRDFTVNKQKQVDDYPYGGGRGAVMQADPLYRCWAHIRERFGTEKTRTIYLSPCGTTFSQAKARQLLADYDHLILVCGHYEGIDERFIEECVDEEISLGDFVLTGGGIADQAGAGEAFWSTPSTAALRSGTADGCRRCSSAATTPTWPGGGNSSPCSAPSAAGPTCSGRRIFRAPSRTESCSRRSMRCCGRSGRRTQPPVYPVNRLISGCFFRKKRPTMG